MRIEHHLLARENGTSVPFTPSPNSGGWLEQVFLVVHYTAGTDADSSIDWFVDERSHTSAHIVIGRDGSVTQLVPFNRNGGPKRWSPHPIPPTCDPNSSQNRNALRQYPKLPHDIDAQHHPRRCLISPRHRHHRQQKLTHKSVPSHAVFRTFENRRIFTIENFGQRVSRVTYPR